eukprot:m.121602 g.121602  ORF g.121602 m.121602 type:complete len:175 (+) comp16541_c0_seq2:132-656(+)
MVTYLISRFLCNIVGSLYPGYCSYKAVKTKNVKEYMHWMKYWTVFAFFLVAESITDIVLYWFPFYYELKIVFLIFIVVPRLHGADYVFRHLLHPTISEHEGTIDGAAEQARQRVVDATSSMWGNMYTRAFSFVSEFLATQNDSDEEGDDAAGGAMPTDAQVPTSGTLRSRRGGP